jgi:hypothetical protein
MLRELGAVVLPEVVPGPQSFMALFELVVAPLLVPLLAPLEELGVLEAVLPGPQSVLWPVMPLEVPALVPGVLLPSVVLLVCAMAAVPSVSAMTDAAVRRSRFIELSFRGAKRVPRGTLSSRKPEAATARSGLARGSRSR